METEKRETVIEGRRKGAEGDVERQTGVLENHSAGLDSLRKIDHRKLQRGSSQVTAAEFIYTADDETTAESTAVSGYQSLWEIIIYKMRASNPRLTHVLSLI